MRRHMVLHVYYAITPRKKGPCRREEGRSRIGFDVYDRRIDLFIHQMANPSFGLCFFFLPPLSFLSTCLVLLHLGLNTLGI